MESGKRHSLSRIRADYRSGKFAEELANEWMVALVFRPLGILLAWALQASVVSPMALTLLSFSCLLLAVGVAAVITPSLAMPLLVALGLVFQVLDCADGSLARLTGQTSNIGQYADTLTDLCFRMVFYGSAGWVMQQHQDIASSWLSSGGFFLAILSAWLMTLARLCRIYFELRFSSSGSGDVRNRSVIDVIVGLVSGLDAAIPLIAAAAWYLDAPAAFYWWIVIYALADFLNTQAAIVAALLRRPS